MKRYFLLFLCLPHMLCGVNAVFRNLSEKQIRVWVEYTDCPPDRFTLGGTSTVRTTKHIANGCTIRRVSAQALNVGFTVTNMHTGPIQAIHDHESGSAQYYFNLQYGQTFVLITKDRTL